MTAQTALIGDYFTGDDRNALTGLQISARNLGGLVFILSAGWVATLSPRLPFAIYALAAAVLPLMWLVIVDLPRLSPAGVNLADPSDEQGGWRLPLALLVLLQGATNMIFFIMPTQLAFFLDAQGYDSAIMTGSALGVLMLSGGGFALLYARIQRVVGYAGIFALGYGAMALGFLMLLLASTTAAIFAAVAAIGAGYALVSPGFVALALPRTGAEARARRRHSDRLDLHRQFCSPLVSTPVIAGYGYGSLFGGTATLLACMTSTAVLAGGVRRLRRR